MDSELCSSATVNCSKHFVGCENVGWVIEKVLDRDDAWICDFFQSPVSVLSHGSQWDVEFGSPDWVFEEFEPFLSFFELVVEKESLEVLHLRIDILKSNRNDV